MIGWLVGHHRISQKTAVGTIVLAMIGWLVMTGFHTRQQLE